MSSSDEEELLLLALSCKRERRWWWMYEINEKLFSQSSCTLGDLYCTRTRTPALFQLIFQWILPPFRTARLANLSPKHKCPLPAASARLWFDGDYAVLHNTVRKPSRRGHKSLPAASARLPFDGDDAVLHNTVRTPSRRGHRSLPAASARLLFDGDDAVLRNTVRTPSRREHRSLPTAAAPFLCGRTQSNFSFIIATHDTFCRCNFKQLFS